MKTALQIQIEAAWISRAKTQGLKPKSMPYKRAEIEFFAGAMVAMHACDPNATADKLSPTVPPVWVINVMRDMPIVDVDADALGRTQ